MTPTGRCHYKERNEGRKKSLLIPYRSVYTVKRSGTLYAECNFLSIFEENER